MRTPPLAYVRTCIVDKGRLLLLGDAPKLTCTNISFTLSEQDFVGIRAHGISAPVEMLFGAQNEVRSEVYDDFTLIGQHRGGQLRLSLFYAEADLLEALAQAAMFAKELALMVDDERRRSFVVNITAAHLTCEPQALHDFMTEYLA